MTDEMMKQICSSFSLPIYAVVHDSVVKALQSSGASQQDVMNILEALPKLPLNSKEQDELQNAKGAIELEDSFGSGNYFIMDAGNQEAYVLSDSNNADYLNAILEGKPQEGNNKPDKKPESKRNKAASMQVHSAGQANNQTQSQQSQSQGQQDPLAQLQLMQLLSQGNPQNQPQGQNMIQQLAMLEMMQGSDFNKLLNDLRMAQLIMGVTGSGGQNGQQINMKQQEQKQQAGQQQTGQQQTGGQQMDFQQILAELQLLRSLQR